ncbi:MAG: alpha/beta fold hydrolase [Sphingomonadaceae bacterium]|uniref:alpha/beta fold hydrolase n=1 Tax=Thermaurantiacus sp. TaxID=2820283 RepID=UPI00298F1DE0|nr:alpha/beta hydrolase family protein [Thermaurantiacus sp.]MCS6987470.1 alpha/beta fold hydrolase [Sphingomonadaceae bacterium]MDW8415390.1 alpha/beta hydrolase family protein [Thermaurantiacus sp.]
MTTFVLVHGAWHGGWVWRDVARHLRAAGHDVLTPTLTGLGERAHLLAPQVGIALHAQDIRAVLEWEELEDVVLAGHSYGALPAALACDHPAVARFVSVDGVPIVPGRALADRLSPEAVEAARATLVNGLGLPAPDPVVFDVPADHPGHAWVKRRVTPLPWRCVHDALPALPPRFAQLPRAYLAAGRNSMAEPARGRAQAETEGWPLKVIDSGHDLPVTAPAETAHALAELAQA